MLCKTSNLYSWNQISNMFKLIPLQISFGNWQQQQWHCEDRQWQWRKKKILSALRASQLFPWFDQPWFTPDFCPHECCLNTWGYENFKGFKLRTSHHERIFFSHIIELCRISLSTSKGFRFPHHPWTSLPQSSHSNFCTWQRGLRTSLDRQRGGWETWRWARKTHPCSCRGEQRIHSNESPPPSGRGKPERLTLTWDWTPAVLFDFYLLQWDWLDTLIVAYMYHWHKQEAKTYYWNMSVSKSYQYQHVKEPLCHQRRSALPSARPAPIPLGSQSACAGAGACMLRKHARLRTLKDDDAKYL